MRSREWKVRCPGCGDTPNEDSDIFRCPECGTEGFECCFPAGNNTLCLDCETGGDEPDFDTNEDDT